jgi:hypothetical protein
VAEVEDFVDFLRQRVAEQATTRDAAQLSERVRLSPRERMRLLRLVEQASSDPPVYAAAPPKADEFSTDDEDALAWEREGWESFG